MERTVHVRPLSAGLSVCVCVCVCICVWGGGQEKFKGFQVHTEHTLILRECGDSSNVV